MRLIDRILGRYRVGYNEYVASGAAIVLEQTYGPKGQVREQPPTDYTACKRLYSTNGIVYAAILARMQLFSQVKFVFQDRNDGKFSDLPPRAEILEHPWPTGTTSELLSRMLLDVDLAGNAYIWKAEPDLLVRLEPNLVSIVHELLTDSQGRKYRVLRGYWWDPSPTGEGQPSKDAQFYLPEEVAHWAPSPDPDARYRGRSWLASVFKDITSDQALTEYKMRYLYQAATPNMVMQYKQKLQKETIDALRERMQARYGGVDNAFKTLILDQGADVKVVGANLDQLNFVNVQAAGESRVLMAAGVPGIVVGAKEGMQAATYSNYQQAMRRFADVTIHPLWQSVCACLDNGIVNPPSNMRLWYDPRDISALRQNELERAQAMQVQAAAIGSLARYNFIPSTVIDFLATGDVNMLKVKGDAFVQIPAAIPLDRPVIEHQGANIPPPPAPGQARPVAGAAANKPVAGQIGTTGGTSSPGPNGKTNVSAARK